MPIEFPCPTCSQTVRAPETAAGKKGKCTHCGAIVRIPAPAAPETAPEPPSAPPPAPAAPALIEFPCPTCQQTVRTPAAAAGKKGKCPHCQTVVRIPEASTAAPIPAPPAAAPKPAPAPKVEVPAPKLPPPAKTEPVPKPKPPAKPAAPLPKAKPLGSTPAPKPGKWKGGDQIPTLTPLGPGPGPAPAPAVSPLDDPFIGVDQPGFAPGPAPFDPLGGLAPLGPDPLGSNQFQDPLAGLPPVNAPALNPLGIIPAPSPYQATSSPRAYRKQEGSVAALVLSITALVISVLGLITCVCCVFIPLPTISLILASIALCLRSDVNAKVMAIIALVLSLLPIGGLVVSFFINGAAILADPRFQQMMQQGR